jgi:exodeoxyribonuclease V alpha subunit
LGQPIQILRNDYNVDLMNGDIGLVLPNQDGVLVAAFTSVEDGKKTLKHVQLTQLPPHVSSFCMTVHKSQGSQFSRVALLMAGQDSPIQTRELIYTALTRTKSRFDWIGNKKEMESALRRRITRASGLSDLLWHP